MPPKFIPDIQRILLENITQTLKGHIYGTITLYGSKIPNRIQFTPKSLKVKSITPHLPQFTKWDSVCSTSVSLAVTNDIAYCFLFLHLLRCFNSVGSQSYTDRHIKTCQEVPLGNLGFQRCMLLAQAYRSLPRPS